MDAPNPEARGFGPDKLPGVDSDLMALSWPMHRLGEAVDALVRQAGFQISARHSGTAAPPPMQAFSQVSPWLEWAAEQHGLEAEPVDFALPELDQGLAKACPSVLTLHDGTELRFLLLLKAKGRRIDLIGPDLHVHRRSPTTIRDAAAARFEVPLARDIDRLLISAEVSARRRGSVRSVMLRERLATQLIGGCVLLRLPATAPFWSQVTQAGLRRRVGWVIAMLAGVYGVEILGWALLGAAALDGRPDLGWLAAWVLLLISNIPLRLCAGWLDATFALDLGRILKRRLLAGALRIRIDQVRHQGAGQLLGRVMESQALESLALNGGMALVVAAVELVFSAWILLSGAGGVWHLLTLMIWLTATLAFCWGYFHRLRAWSATRLQMTHRLIENMVGHRTRLAQERPSRRDDAEDRVMNDYLGRSRNLDHAMIPIAVGAAGGWAIIALLGLTPAFVTGDATSAGIAISLGGILLANRAFSGIAGSIASLSQAGVAWSQVSDLFKAAGAQVEPTRFLPPFQAPGNGEPATLIDASELVFCYRPEGQPVLNRLNLTVRHGERILLEGASGGGKSTLAAILTGLLVPRSGLLLLNGLDRHTLGSSWHRFATEAPQFHENHILAGPLAFNLLMGRNWPATEDDLEEARALCEQLGLGSLLQRMPAGLMQQVGETGWQLSHGERSRIFLARALLQDAQLTILDESFAALDPETLQICLRTAMARARTLIVIAHP